MNFFQWDNKVYLDLDPSEFCAVGLCYTDYYIWGKDALISDWFLMSAWGVKMSCLRFTFAVFKVHSRIIKYI